MPSTLAKSRRFSTTFKALREARARHAASAAAGESAKSDHNLIRVGVWSYAGSGYPKAGDALLADSSHARAREHRRLAREAAIEQRSRTNDENREAA